MLEQEEQNLRQQLMERDMRLQESERRQEVSFLTFQKSDFWFKKMAFEVNQNQRELIWQKFSEIKVT